MHRFFLKLTGPKEFKERLNTKKHYVHGLCTRKALAPATRVATRHSHVSSSSSPCRGHNVNSSLLALISFSKIFKNNIFTNFSDLRSMAFYEGSHGSRKTSTSIKDTNLVLKYGLCDLLFGYCFIENPPPPYFVFSSFTSICFC
jgi:hypothetical protein